MQWRREQNTLLFSGEIEITSFDKQVFETLCVALDQEISTIDFADVTFADSSCVSLILSLLRRHKLTFKNIPQSARLLIDLYELNTLVSP